MSRLFYIILALFIVALSANGADEHKFVGLKKCSMCHKGEKKGNIAEIWQASAHANAFKTLGEPKALEVYMKLGKSGNPQADPACLKCHTTGHGGDSTIVAKLAIENGVTCESCHGAGGDYWKIPVMKNHDKAVANGLNAAPKDGCVKCHNKENPTYKPFKFEERWEKIKHAVPPKAEK